MGEGGNPAESASGATSNAVDALEDLDSVRVAAGATPPPTAAVSRQAYDPSRDRETKRGQIAAQLLTLLTILTLAPFVLALARGICVRAVARGGCLLGLS